MPNRLQTCLRTIRRAARFRTETSRATRRYPVNTKIGRPILAFLLTVLAALALPAGEASAQLIEKEIRRGVMDNPIRLDPQFATLPSERAILVDVFLGLVTEDAAGNIGPGGTSASLLSTAACISIRGRATKRMIPASTVLSTSPGVSSKTGD